MHLLAQATRNHKDCNVFGFRFGFGVQEKRQRDLIEVGARAGQVIDSVGFGTHFFGVEGPVRGGPA